LSLSPLSSTPKAVPAWPTQVADHLVPNQVLGLFEFQGEREREKFFVFKGLQKPLSAQIQGNEDAPFAAYCLITSQNKFETLSTLTSLVTCVEL
jgi:hypothetical protein